MQTLITPEEIRSLEASYIKSKGSSLSLELMEKAGFALAEEIKSFEGPYLIICGKGNNAGDGIVAARYLHENNKKVVIVLTSNHNILSSDAKVNFDLIKDKVPFIVIETGEEKDFLDIFNDSKTIADCLLGTGSTRKLPELFKKIIEKVNNSGKNVVACDVPTGVNSATGEVNETAFKSNITVTFGYAKIGLVIYPAKKYVGELKIVDISLPKVETNYYLLDDIFFKANFPKREIDANKGKFGRTLLVCGSDKYPGAALLSSRAASSIGSGLTSLSSPKECLEKISGEIPEVTHVEFSAAKILEESLRASVLVIGPGLTREGNITKLVESLITKANVPIVLDADGINVLSGNKEILKSAKKERVLTPHPKEFSRLMGLELSDVLSNKIKFASNASKELDCTVVLKGAATLVATKNGKLYVSPFANPALAKGGTGDVLAGFIGGLIAQGLEAELAASIGVYVHGQSAELVTKDKTVFSLLPQDLITYLPSAIKFVMDQ